MRPKAEWAFDSEAMRARGITVLVTVKEMCPLTERALFLHYLLLITHKTQHFFVTKVTAAVIVN